MIFQGSNKRSRPRPRSRLAVPAILAVSVGMTGCGVSTRHDPPITTVLVDCSKSVRGNQSQWPQEMSRIAEKVLTAEGRLRVGCFAGIAGGITWTTDIRGEEARKVTGGTAARREYQRAWARGLVNVFTKTVQPRKEGGTDWLNALEAASQTERLVGVYMFSDLVQQDEGVNLTSPQPAGRLEAVALAWSRRLGGLHGASVIVIGGGQGVGQQIDRQGEQLFEYLRKDVPFAGRLLNTVP